MEQAEIVTYLTRLAIVFLPLNLASAIFGMNLKEFQNMNWWWYVLMAFPMPVFSLLPASLRIRGSALKAWEKAATRVQKLAQ